LVKAHYFTTNEDCLNYFIGVLIIGNCFSPNSNNAVVRIKGNYCN